MNYRTTCFLFVVVCVLAGLLWFLTHHVEPTDQRRLHEGRVLDVGLVHADSVVMQHAGQELEIERRNEEWWIVRPIEGRANEAAVGRLLDAFEALTYTEIITREQRQHRALSLGDYGLDVSGSAVAFRTPLGVRRVLIGHEARLGAACYLRIDGSPDVLVAQGPVREVLPASLDMMRDRLLWHGQATRVVRIEIERPAGGFVQLLRTAAGWGLQQPVREPADGVAVNALLDALFAGRISAFVWDPPAGVATVASEALSVVDAPAAPVESYGLAADTFAARIRLWQAGEDVGRELTLGKRVEADAGSVYAMYADRGGIFTLDAELLEHCLVSADDLRSRALVELDPRSIRYLAVQRGDQKLALGYTPEAGWAILEPIQWAADRETVAHVLRTLTEARIQAFVDTTATNAVAVPGDGSTVLHVTLDTDYPARDAENGAGDDMAASKSDTETGRCELRATENGVDDQMLVSVSGRIGSFLVRRDALVFLPGAAALPLAFFDRTVLSIPPDRVQRIEIRRENAAQFLERNADGTWRTKDGNAERLDALGLSDFLFRVSNLRAERVAAQHPKDLAPFGLGQADASVTIGLKGSEAIQKTILVGAQAGSSGRYAMIQGQDVVFVISQDMVDRLLGNLVTVAAEPAQE